MPKRFSGPGGPVKPEGAVYIPSPLCKHSEASPIKRPDCPECAENWNWCHLCSYGDWEMPDPPRTAVEASEVLGEGYNVEQVAEAQEPIVREAFNG